MSLPAFEVIRPESLGAALQAIGRFGSGIQMVAGGTDLIPSMKQGLFSPRALLDLKSIRTLDFIHPEAGSLTIGALTRISSIAESQLIREQYPVLHQAAKTVASPLLRNMGTLGGNLCLDTRCLYYNQSGFWRDSLGYCLKKDGSVCHVAPGGHFCWAAFSGDLAPALLTLDARIRLVSPTGERTIPISEFYLNDGIARTVRRPDEILISVHIPASSAGMNGVYKKLRIRQSIDYPLAGVAAVMKQDASGTCVKARIALTAVNPSPQLVKVAERLEGKRFDAALVEEVAYQAVRTAKPLRTSASTMEYRRHMVQVFVRRALRELWASHGGASVAS
ncbi:MAG: FAD binding domain-containing protein [Terriglobia bacterium]